MLKLKINKNKIIRFLKDNYIALILILILVGGVIYNRISVDSFYLDSKWKTAMTTYLNNNTQGWANINKFIAQYEDKNPHGSEADYINQAIRLLKTRRKTVYKSIRDVDFIHKFTIWDVLKQNATGVIVDNDYMKLVRFMGQSLAISEGGDRSEPQ